MSLSFGKVNAMTYIWRCLQQGFSFKSLPFGIDRWLLSIPKGWKISFGFWVKYTVDDADADAAIRNSSGIQGLENAYSPLDHMRQEIRLIKLFPSNEGQSLELDIIQCSLLDHPAYEALSYVWEPYNESRKINLMGREISITKNLHDALLTFRRSDAPRLLWVDAISIDQNNIYERQHQVSIMDQIYHKATSVVVFLGLASPDSDLGMSALRFFTEASLVPAEAPWLSSPMEVVEQGLLDIFTRRWFTRIWTVQEAALARRTVLMCGNETLSWEGNLKSLKRLLFRIKSTAISPEWGVGDMVLNSVDWSPLINIIELQMRQVAMAESVRISKSLLDIAFDFRHRQASDPRDKYYAIFNLESNQHGGRLALQPDYMLSLDEVHERFVREIGRLSEAIETSREAEEV